MALAHTLRGAPLPPKPPLIKPTSKSSSIAKPSLKTSLLRVKSIPTSAVVPKVQSLFLLKLHLDFNRKIIYLLITSISLKIPSSALPPNTISLKPNKNRLHLTYINTNLIRRGYLLKDILENVNKRYYIKENICIYKLKEILKSKYKKEDNKDKDNALFKDINVKSDANIGRRTVLEANIFLKVTIHSDY
ncbi:hypothetical protein B0T21DRAFT_353527 [Apiosordaria backusii]|uniref:Uncharacterized protein n=1 Tax=Apiosordaria backusii TaxID=314023 RepID=A0AA39ZS90_9PEZI|nr:hypothetical protein B0T21DRAFT_353527 [Apiosordaria backusii]